MLFLQNAWVIAGVFAVSAGMYLCRRQWENVVTRACVALFYAALALDIINSMDIVRSLSRWFIFLLGVVEIVSYYARRWLARKAAKKPRGGAKHA